MKKILLVDDAPFMRMMVNDILAKNFAQPYVTVEAEDGEAGVAAFKEHAPDLVILNITMPKMDGIDALRRIRAHDPAARVLMLSALARAAVVAAALMEGARFVVKPFSPDKLMEEINRVLEEETPAFFNRETLEAIITAAHRNTDTHNQLLSQVQIDTLTRTAQQPNATPADISNLVEILQVSPSVFFPSADGFAEQLHLSKSADGTVNVDALVEKLATIPTNDPTLKTLENLASGQEKIIALLEKLVAQEARP